MTHPKGTLEALGADQRTILGRAPGDALDRRTPAGDCTAHADDLGLCRAYREPGGDLGIEAGQ